MFSTCLFCHASLGTNEVIETFPVGRRLAFDPAKGRLWAVCFACSRWNLSPLEERWEAIEDCDRRFRETTMRVSTEHIGLARLREGLELVRIGEPQRPEFAAWRYGDQFGRRRRKAMLALGAGVGTVAAVGIGGVAVGIVSVGSLWTLFNVTNSLKGLHDNRRLLGRAVDENGKKIEIRGREIHLARVVKVQDQQRWKLRLGEHPSTHDLTGLAAVRVTALLLARINRLGGSEKKVREAVTLLEVGGPPFSEPGDRVRPELRFVGPLPRLPVEARLALEMAAHEETERRALEGELAILENAWRDAEEIANIADNLFLPAGVEEWLARLKGRI